MAQIRRGYQDPPGTIMRVSAKRHFDGDQRILDAQLQDLSTEERAGLDVVPVVGRVGHDIEGGNAMAGLDKIGHHRATHIAQPDKSDRCHSFSPLLARG